PDRASANYLSRTPGADEGFYRLWWEEEPMEGRDQTRVRRQPTPSDNCWPTSRTAQDSARPPQAAMRRTKGLALAFRWRNTRTQSEQPTRKPPRALRVQLGAGWAIRGLVARVAEGDERVERVPAEPQRCPTVALVAALPEPTVGEAGEEAAIGGEEHVGHRW